MFRICTPHIMLPHITLRLDPTRFLSVLKAVFLRWRRYSSEAALETLGGAFEDACKTARDLADVMVHELKRSGARFALARGSNVHHYASASTTADKVKKYQRKVCATSGNVASTTVMATGPPEPSDVYLSTKPGTLRECLALAAKGQEEEGEKGIEAFDRQVIPYPSAVLTLWLPKREAAADRKIPALIRRTDTPSRDSTAERAGTRICKYLMQCDYRDAGCRQCPWTLLRESLADSALV